MQICSGCHAGCCRSFAVPIHGADVLRLERETGLTFWDFGCRWADPNGQIARGAYPHFYFADEPKMPFVLCLQHTPSKTFEGTTKCRFLVESPRTERQPRGTALCGVYQDRPSACRVFPAKFDQGGQLAILYDIPTQGRTEQHPAYELCPRPWQVDDVDPVAMVQDLVVSNFELQFFQEVAAIWNRRAGEFALLPEFLRLVYEQRVRKPEPVSYPLADEPAVIPVAEERRARAA